MAEPRRVQLACLSPGVSLTPPPAKKPRIEEQEPETHTTATVRIALTLFEPDQKRCPEFCYPELLRNPRGSGKKASLSEKSKKKTVSLVNEEEAEKKELAAIARRFNEKYGNKKKRRDRVEDLVDMGYGYDESDSFIDNSEAYDELVPASLSTKHGGFYINTGTLQFRQASESEDDVVKEKKKVPKVGLCLLSVCSPGNLFCFCFSCQKMKERGEKVKKKKREEVKKSKKAKYPKTGFTALNGNKEKKKKKNPENITDMLARFNREKETQKMTSVSLSVASSLKPATPPPLPPNPPKEAEPAPDPILANLLSDAEFLQASNAIDSLSEKELENLFSAPPDKPERAQAATPTEEPFKKPPSIPDGLPPPLEKRVKELTKAVRASECDKKTILFTQEMNSALLDIYILSRDLCSAQRSAVFTHLSSVLPCSKETLVKWASRLHLHKQGGRLREPLRKLKEAVAKTMPEQVNKYHEECKIHNQAKYAKKVEDEKEQKVGSEEEEEEEEKTNKKPAGPRKKFQWNEEIRQLLYQLVRMKVDMFESEGSGMLSLEDYLKSFLDVEVKPVWPRGWMQARALFKETRRVYPQLSSIMAKNRALNQAKVKTKDTSNKHDKKPVSPQVEAQGSLVVPSSISAKDSPVPSSVVSSAQPGPSALPSLTQDNSLDGDLIHNLPTLDAVSEHLTALSSRSAGLGFDFPTSRPGLSEKTAVAEEKRKSCPPLPTAPVTTNSQPRVFLVDQPLILGAEKKLTSSHTAKPSPEAHQGKAKQHHNHGTIKSPQLSSSSLQPSVKLYQMNSQHGKGNFQHPTHSGNPRGSTPSPPQRPSTPQSKPFKPQGFLPTSTTAANTHKPILSPSFIGKHMGNANNTGPQVYRHAVPRHPVPPNSNPAVQNSIVSVTHTSSPPTLARSSITVPTKKPNLPPQKLTLVAPQNSGGGTQGVAKLLTSSMVGSAVGSAASPSAITQSTKSGAASALLTQSPSLAVLTPSYKPNGGKVPTPTSLGILSPIHAFPLHVISFTTDSAPKAAASKDAVVTGPAPGTFHHGLPRNLLGTLHSNSNHHSAPLPHPSLSAQTGQTDVTHIHAKGPTAPTRKL
ncbi:ubinuclein-1 [Pelodytes ibericus]